MTAAKRFLLAAIVEVCVSSTNTSLGSIGFMISDFTFSVLYRYCRYVIIELSSGSDGGSDSGVGGGYLL